MFRLALWVTLAVFAAWFSRQDAFAFEGLTASLQAAESGSPSPASPADAPEDPADDPAGGEREGPNENDFDDRDGVLPAPTALQLPTRECRWVSRPEPHVRSRVPEAHDKPPRRG